MELSLNTCLNVERSLSNMTANMAAKTQKYVYLSLSVGYNSEESVECNIFRIKESKYGSGNSVAIVLSKTAANVAAKTQNPWAEI